MPDLPINHEHWHQLCGLIMRKMEVPIVKITRQDILDAFATPAVVEAQETPEGFTIAILELPDGEDE
jgi:hypothetical protein